MNWAGDYPEDFTTVAIYFTTHDVNGAPVAPLTGYEAADVTIYKNGSATQKTSTNGVTMTSPFDSIVGLHCVVIDTSNDTGDSGFWTTGGGGVYSVVLIPDTETVNGQTTVKVVGTFGIKLSGASTLTAAQIATGVWTDTTAGDFTTALSVGKSVMNGVALGTGLTVNTVTNQLTAAQIATGVWTDTTAGDFTTALSVGKSVMNGVTLGTGLTVNTVTNQLTAAAIATGVWTDTTAGDFTTALSVGKSVMNGVTLGTGLTVNTVTNQLTAAAIATGVWTDTTAGDFTTALSVGKSVMNGVTLGTGLTVNDITTKSGYSLSSSQTFNVTGNITGNLTGSVGSVTGLTASNLDTTVSSRMASYTQPTGFLAATFPGTVASTTNITGGTITTVTTLTGLTASDVGAIKAKTDSLAFTVPGFADVNIQYVNDVQVNGDGSGTPWGP